MWLNQVKLYLFNSNIELALSPYLTPLVTNSRKRLAPPVHFEVTPLPHKLSLNIYPTKSQALVGSFHKLEIGI